MRACFAPVRRAVSRAEQEVHAKPECDREVMKRKEILKPRTATTSEEERVGLDVEAPMSYRRQRNAKCIPEKSSMKNPAGVSADERAMRAK